MRTFRKAVAYIENLESVQARPRAVEPIARYKQIKLEKEVFAFINGNGLVLTGQAVDRYGHEQCEIMKAACTS